MLYVASQSAKILDIVSSVEDAALSEQSGSEYVPLVQQVSDGVRVLG